MSFWKQLISGPDSGLTKEELNEALKQFVNKGDDISPASLKNTQGEGIDDINLLAQGFSGYNVGTFNGFYNSYINRIYASELQKINEYRNMAAYPEIGDVIEDAVNECTQDDKEGRTIKMMITDSELSNDRNISKVLFKEFDDFFYHRLEINDLLEEYLRNYFIDGRVYYERIINTNRPADGIQKIKRLPSETMDYVYDPMTGKILWYYQYLKLSPQQKRPTNLEEAKKRDDIVIFNPEQIGFINYGIYGRSRLEIFGYLEKAKVPYNQLKLLETSVIIYRIVRAPERFVFKIDTGNMPKDKAMKFVEKIKQRFIKRQTYDPQTGNLTHEPEVLSILENFFLPQSADGRGSAIETVGGNASGFTELDDIYYFARKLYRALKYPMSRVSAGAEKREAEITIGGSHANEIARDEVKWARFLQRQQDRFCDEMRDLFLLHLEFKGLKKYYKLNKDKIRVMLNPPSNYKDSMEQSFLETRFANYNQLANNEEFSKYFLMKKYLEWSDEEIEENIRYKKEKDKLLMPQDEEGGGEEPSGGEGGGESESIRPEVTYNFGNQGDSSVSTGEGE